MYAINHAKSAEQAIELQIHLGAETILANTIPIFSVQSKAIDTVFVENPV